MTQRGSGGGVLAEKHDDKSCWCTFSSKSRQLSSAWYARHARYLFFSTPPFPDGKELVYLRIQNTLMWRTLLWGSHYCEHLWTVEFNWATANVYCVWKEEGINCCLIAFRWFLIMFSFFLWCVVRCYKKQPKAPNQTVKSSKSLWICKSSNLVVLIASLGKYSRICRGRWESKSSKSGRKSYLPPI